MCCEGFMKRIVPFFLTFAVGLFVASFFVTIAAPKFEFNRGWRKHQQYHRKMEFENQRLKEENSRLKAESQAKVKSFTGTYEMDNDGSVKRIKKMEATFESDSLNDLVPPPPPISPAPYRR